MNPKPLPGLSPRTNRFAAKSMKQNPPQMPNGPSAVTPNTLFFAHDFGNEQFNAGSPLFRFLVPIACADPLIMLWVGSLVNQPKLIAQVFGMEGTQELALDTGTNLLECRGLSLKPGDLVALTIEGGNVRGVLLSFTAAAA